MEELIDINKIMRRCYKCGKTKPLKEFRKKTKSTLGYGYICRVCHNEQKNKWKKKNGKSYYEENKEYIKKYAKKYYQENKEKIKERSIKHSKKRMEEYKNLREELINKKGGRCPLCGFEGNTVVFDFHHTNEDGYRTDWSKSHNISKKIKTLSDWMENGVPDDIMIICANCHRIIHNTP